LARKVPGVGSVATLQRLALDQLVFAPCFIPVFFSFALVLEGKPEEIPDKLRNDLVTTVLANYAVWVPSQYINFRHIAPRLQVGFSNLVGFFWNIYFSYQNFKEKKTIVVEIDDNNIEIVK
jgi:hypothetical protein